MFETLQKIIKEEKIITMENKSIAEYTNKISAGMKYMYRAIFTKIFLTETLILDIKTKGMHVKRAKKNFNNEKSFKKCIYSHLDDICC